VVGVRKRQGIADLHGPYAAGRVIIIVDNGATVLVMKICFIRNILKRFKGY
jgi:hypothetical protein